MFDGEKLVSHFENLVPGLATLAAWAFSFPSELESALNPPGLQLLFDQEFFASAVMIAVAYLLGTAVFSLSRLVIDSFSRVSFRWLFLVSFRRSDFASLHFQSVNGKYTQVIDAVLRRSPAAISAEVLRRRQRGRIVRTLWLPLSIVLLPRWGFLGPLFALLFTTLLYGYVEYSLYQEAQRAPQVPA